MYTADHLSAYHVCLTDTYKKPIKSPGIFSTKAKITYIYECSEHIHYRF